MILSRYGCNFNYNPIPKYCFLTFSDCSWTIYIKLAFLQIAISICLSTIGHSTATLNTNHENLFYVAAADMSTVYREQDNLAYDLKFTTSDAGINIVGISLIPSTIGSATFNAYAVSPTTIRIELLPGSAAPGDYYNALSASPNLSWSHDGVASNINLNIEFRAVDAGAVVVFEGYTTTSAANSDITPISINGTPPFGASKFSWIPLAPSSPSGLSFNLVDHDGIFGTSFRRWAKVSIGTGPAWTNQNTDFKVEFQNNLGNIIHNPVLTFDLRLRSFSPITIYQGQVLHSAEGPISATGAGPGGYGLTTFPDDGSNISLHPDLGAVDSYNPASGWDTDTEMDVEITDGTLCTTITVRDINVRFRALKADGYTIFKGHARGEKIINTALPNDTYTFSQLGGASAFPVVTAASGITPLVSLDIDGSFQGFITPPPSNQWATDDSFDMLIKDGTRPQSRVSRAISLRELPANLSYFDQQIAATDATIPSPAGSYTFSAIDPSWIPSPSGTPPVFLGPGDPQPIFSGSGELLDYINGSPSPVSYPNILLIGNGSRPWSAGTGVLFFLRHISFAGSKVDAGNPVEIPQNGNFDLDTVDPGTSWTWSSASLSGFISGSVSISSGSGPSATFSSTNVDGSGKLTFDIGPGSTSPFHPTITIQLDAFESTVVPLELLSFQAYLFNSKVYLRWTTMHEVGCESFDVFKYTSQNSWFQLSRQSCNGNSSSKQDYIAIDINPKQGENKYRLRTYDLNGSYSDSHVITINVDKQIPIKTKFRVGDQIEFENENSIALFSVDGQLIALNSGNSLIIPDVPSGIYILRLKSLTYKVWIIGSP